MVNLISQLAEYLFPHTCIFCQSETLSFDLCHDCYCELPFYPNRCLCCAAHLSTTQDLCGACIKKPPAYNRTFPLFCYQAPITKLLMELKFHASLVNARILGTLLAQALQREYYNKPLPELIIPVPLHPNRLKKRGFNQALELGRPLAKTLQIPLQPHLATRPIETRAQAKLMLKSRHDFVKNPFTISQSLAGKHIAIIDDVITTGQTITALSKACKQAGASQIDVWCVAKSLLE